LELYVLGGYGDGRKHIQIFNKNYPCCYSGNGYETYEFVIKDKILQLGKGDSKFLLMIRIMSIKSLITFLN